MKAEHREALINTACDVLDRYAFMLTEQVEAFENNIGEGVLLMASMSFFW